MLFENWSSHCSFYWVLSIGGQEQERGKVETPAERQEAAVQFVPVSMVLIKGS